MLSKVTGLTILICWGLLLGMFALGNQMSQYENILIISLIKKTINIFVFLNLAKTFAYLKIIKIKTI